MSRVTEAFESVIDAWTTNVGSNAAIGEAAATQAQTNADIRRLEALSRAERNERLTKLAEALVIAAIIALLGVVAANVYQKFK